MARESGETVAARLVDAGVIPDRLTETTKVEIILEVGKPARIVVTLLPNGPIPAEIFCGAEVTEISDDMPVFVIKAKDKLAVLAVECYRELCLESGLLEQAVEVRKAVGEMINWRTANRDKIKTPDHEHVPVSEGSASDGEGIRPRVDDAVA